MRPLAVAVALVGSVALAMTLIADPKPRTSEEGKYTAAFPGKVKAMNETEVTVSGPINVVTDLCEVTPKLAFMVNYNDFPAATFNDDPQTVLERLAEGNAGPTGKVERNDRIEFGPSKAPGRDVVIYRGGLYFRNRAVLSGNRLYQVMVVGPKADVFSKKADAFIASFAITP